MNDMYTKWHELQELEISICEYFRIKNMKHITICGEDESNTYLQEELERANISYSVNCNYEMADIIVVTEAENYFEIEKNICELYIVEVISISELIEKIYNNRNDIKH